MYMDYFEDKESMLKIIVITGIIACVICLLFSGCNSFKAIQLENQTPECNDFYTVLQYYSELDKDSAFIGTVYNECKNSRENAKQKKIEKLCGDLYADKNEYMKCVK